jgi:two-component system phosphate regulon sensor histidine kinase PhoR
VRAAWSQELWRLGGVLVLCLLLGLITGRARDFLLLGLAGALFLNLYNLQRFLAWLGASEGLKPRDARGVWGEIYYRVYQLQRRNRKRKRKLTRLLAQFQASAEALPDAAVALGENWEIHWFNDAAIRLLGLRPGQDVGGSIRNLLRNPEFHAYLGAARFDHSIEIGAPGNSGRRLAVRIIPYAGNQRLLLAQDVTERYRLERVRRDFVANASHELRTPLTVIAGFVENMRHEESEASGRWARPLALMEQQTTRMQRIIEDLLLLSGLESGRVATEVDTVDVAQLIGEIRDEAVAAAREDGAIGSDEDLPNDFYIRNPDESTTELTVSPDVLVTLQACYQEGECVTTEQVDLETWSILLGGEEDPGLDWTWYGQGSLPYVFTVASNLIVEIEEVYLP